MSEETGPNHIIHFGFTITLDRNLFFRRTCPSCGLDFKTEVAESDLASELQPTFSQLGLEIGATGLEKSEVATPEYLYCPYCKHHAELSDYLTGEFITYLRRYVEREYLLPLVNQTLSGFANSFDNSGGRSGGLFSVSLSFEFNRAVLPPRPISGPEPPDMTIIELLCCGNKLKVLDGWYDLHQCPYCGTDVLLQ